MRPARIAAVIAADELRRHQRLMLAAMAALATSHFSFRQSTHKNDFLLSQIVLANDKALQS
ncbi:MAG: hypothetical protein KatS3mg057_2985 [Herpetosiphonaceae bacterium]|nr:MAG: hypothetical protein KatS3mg057_2985 [Herpetosiphonaceae bacterium]